METTNVNETRKKTCHSRDDLIMVRPFLTREDLSLLSLRTNGDVSINIRLQWGTIQYIINEFYSNLNA